MKKPSIIVTILCCAAFLALTFLPSCEKYVLPELSADPDTLIFPAAGGTIEVKVSSNVEWSIDIVLTNSWLKCEPFYGKGDATLEVTASPNSGIAKSESHTLKSETITRSIIILQEAASND